MNNSKYSMLLTQVHQFFHIDTYGSISQIQNEESDSTIVYKVQIERVLRPYELW